MFVSSFPRHIKNVGTRIYKVLGVTENLFSRQTKNTNTMNKPVSFFEQFLEKATEHYQQAVSADNACRVGDCAEELTEAIRYTTEALSDLNNYLKLAIKVIK